jgi:hypothetical protein
MSKIPVRRFGRLWCLADLDNTARYTPIAREEPSHEHPLFNEALYRVAPANELPEGGFLVVTFEADVEGNFCPRSGELLTGPTGSTIEDAQEKAKDWLDERDLLTAARPFFGVLGLIGELTGDGKTPAEAAHPMPAEPDATELPADVPPAPEPPPGHPERSGAAVSVEPSDVLQHIKHPPFQQIIKLLWDQKPHTCEEIFKAATGLQKYSAGRDKNKTDQKVKRIKQKLQKLAPELGVLLDLGEKGGDSWILSSLSVPAPNAA